MTELLSATQMREVEQAAIRAGTVTGQELMERAGAGVVSAILAHWPDLGRDRAADRGPAPGPPEFSGQDEGGGRPWRAVVLCGPGNNGGDGFVVARRLRARGWDVEVIHAPTSGSRPAEARVAHGKWTAQNTVTHIDPEAAGRGPRPDLIIDALLGIGVSRPLPREWGLAFQAVCNRAGAGQSRIVALDCPSGFDCDRGTLLFPPRPQGDQQGFTQREVAPRMMSCDLCVTFHRPKIGHYLSETGLGAVPPVVVDIGLDEEPGADHPAAAAPPSGSHRVRLVAPHADAAGPGPGAWLRHVAFPHLDFGAHKYDRGHALVLGGGVGRGGAGRLTARAALRIGAGLVTLGVPRAALIENAAHLDAIMLRGIDDADALDVALQDRRITTLCLGPGLGLGARTRDMVRRACQMSETTDQSPARRLLLDADALTSFDAEPQSLFDLLPRTAVLTPHAGEFARLFPDLVIQGPQGDPSHAGLSKVEAARRAAVRAGCCIVLKGPATVIASPDGAASIHAALYDRCTPWLGTAGAGDVLAGMIAGLLARPGGAQTLHQTVEAAVFLHAECARSFGPGLIAEDLPEELPGVLRRLLA